MRYAPFYEDDAYLIEVLPLVDLPYCLEQTGMLSDVKVSLQGYTGWDALLAQHKASVGLKSLRITLGEVRSALSPALSEYDGVYGGSGCSFPGRFEQTYAFGNDNGPTVYVDVDAEETVLGIWCSDLLVEIQQLPRAGELLLVEWSAASVCSLDRAFEVMHDPAAWDAWLQEQMRPLLHQHNGLR